MTSLTFTSIDLPSAPLGPASPLPLLEPIVPIERIAPDIPSDLADRARIGSPATLFPYRAQDDYGRELAVAPHRVVVLENDALTATVALDLGGRVLSLRDRRSGRELCAVNSALQPANLALRNAWFSGGIEWNIGTRGHSPFTMSTLHAGSGLAPDGGPLLRLWEWERIRGVAFQTDLWMPEGDAVLLARTEIHNVNDDPTPMYWWTNAAVVAASATRVVAPATRAFRTEYPNGLRIAEVPDDGGRDVSYPSRHDDAADFFFDIAPEQRPWIAAVGADGFGTAHVSTGALRGRKLFVWGTAPGGRRWQQWLAPGGDEPYAEIQAGLAATQFEHVTMPPRTTWSWTEAFGAVTVDADRAHSASWDTAVAGIEQAVDSLVGAERLERWHRQGAHAARRAPSAVIASGSGWGALERIRRLRSGEKWFDDAGTPFPDATIGPEQAPWIALLDTGRLPEHPPARPPMSYVNGGDWEARLSAAPADWERELHLGLIAHGRGEHRPAVERYERSMRHAPNAWARYGLAELARRERRHADAAEYAVAAAALAPDELRLVVVAAARLLDADRSVDAIALIESVPAERRSSRLLLLEAFAAAATGNVARAQTILLAGLDVPDIREGERSVDELWSTAFPDRDLPARYDFRMRSG